MRTVERIFLFALVALVAGCASNYTSEGVERLSAEDAGFSQESALLVGFFSEGYLTRPHFPLVRIQAAQMDPATEKTTAFNLFLHRKEKDIDPSPHVAAQPFVIEVPPGEYFMKNWAYIHYSGSALQSVDKPRFSLEAGEVGYLGEVRAIALNMCLKIYENFDNDMARLVELYPMLADRDVRDLTADFSLREWPHEMYADKAVDGKCATLEQITDGS